MQLYAQGYNYREIGEMMGGVPAKNVTAWVSRARKVLKGVPEIAELHSDTF
jgi:DNA-directed RNA polymerase specialized sigma subunit, sigma24 homolog